MSSNIVKVFFIILNIYSCGQNVQSKDCYDLNYKSYKYLDSETFLDSAYYYNDQAYICNPNSKEILKTRYTIFKKKKDFISVIKTLDDLIMLKDSITEEEKNWHKFAKAVIYMSIDEVKYSDSLKANYNYVNSKFNSLKNTVKSREDFKGIFDQKVLYTYYYEGKVNAQDIIKMYPSKHNFNPLDDYIKNNLPPKIAMITSINMIEINKD